MAASSAAGESLLMSGLGAVVELLDEPPRLFDGDEAKLFVAHVLDAVVALRDIVHDGPKMTGTAYRMPNRPVAPGEEVDKEDFVIIDG